MVDTSVSAHNLRQFIVLALIAGALFGFKYLVLMHGGALYGRLTIPPPYDDVTYFTDALERVQLFQAQGLWATMQSFYASPPHSPYAVAGAFLAFLIGGDNPAAPYAINAIAITLIVAGVATAFRWSLWYSVAFFVLLISLTWFDHAVTIYHPDLVAGLAVAAVCAVLVWQGSLLRTPLRVAVAGAAAGLAILAKPSIFPFSIALVTSAFVLGAILARVEDRDWRTPAIRLALGLACVLLVAGPHLAKMAPSLVEYQIAGLVRERVWAYQGDLGAQLAFYLNSARDMLGYWRLVAVFAAMTMALVLFVRGSRAAAFRYLAMLVLIALAYAIPTIPENKNMLFGGALYALLLLTLGIAGADLVRLIAGGQRSPRSRALAPAVPVLILILSIPAIHDGQFRFPAATAASATRLYDGAYDAARAHAQRLAAAGEMRQVVVYEPMPLISLAVHAFRYRGLHEGVDIRPDYSPHDNTLAALTAKAEVADVVVLADSAVAGTEIPFPVREVLPQFREWIDANPRFGEPEAYAWGPGFVWVYTLAPDAGPPAP
ncbi:MAG: hypothetical protein ACT4OF_06895 [Caulobacteraceae bacterium]